jgi:hypothetical protein
MATERTFTKAGKTTVSTSDATSAYLLSQGWVAAGTSDFTVPAHVAWRDIAGAPGWAFVNSAPHPATSLRKPQFLYDPLDGSVALRGFLQVAAAGAQDFITVDPALLPSVEEYWITNCGAGGVNQPVTVQLRVANGDLNFLGVTFGATQHVSLSGIKWWRD